MLDLWEAHCADNEVKSLISNYKNNWFNALFQTPAKIYLHREEFINIIIGICEIAKPQTAGCSC
jgi:hypothetical protein